MKKISLSLISGLALILAGCTLPPAEAPTPPPQGVNTSAASRSTSGILHFISVADSGDATIGQGTAANSQNLHRLANYISSLTGLSLDWSEVSGTEFSCQAIRDAVGRLAPSHNDVIVFYYSGHGFAPPNDPDNPALPAQSKFPWFFCSPEPPHPNLQQIADELTSKQPRLTIVVADTCNVIAAIIEPPTRAPAGVGVPPTDRIKALFLKFNGILVASSSQRNEYSWYKTTGGLFTTKLVGILNNPPIAPDPQLWRSVMSATIPTQGTTLDGPGVIEHPQFDDSKLVFVGGS